LPEPLVWPRRVEIGHLFAQDAPQVPFAQEQDVIQAFAPHAAEEALTGGVRPRCPDGSGQHPDPATRRDAVEARPVLPVVVADQEARLRAERRRLAQLLGDPGIQWVPRDADVDHPARAERDDEEREERAEPEVDDLEEVAGLDRPGMVADEGGPSLPTALGPRRARRAHVPLDRALADPDAQLQELAA